MCELWGLVSTCNSIGTYPIADIPFRKKKSPICWTTRPYMQATVQEEIVSLNNDLGFSSVHSRRPIFMLNLTVSADRAVR